MSKKNPVPREKLDHVRDLVYRTFSHRPNFTAADVGYVWEKGIRTDEISVRIHVERKLPLAELEDHLVIPDEIEGVRVDVIQGEYRPPQPEVARAGHKESYPFLIGGASVSRQQGGAGTLGAIIMDRNSHRPGILSNWHVLAGPYAQPGDIILHPAEMDAGRTAARPIAELSRYILGAQGDAAVAFLSGTDAWVPLQLGSFTHVTSVRRSKLGEELTKTGRTTGTTSGKVDGEGIYRLRYEVRPGQHEARDIRGFRLVSVREGNSSNEEISAPGDSGALYVHQASGSGVGLHFAGEVSIAAAEEFALACNLDEVLDALDVDIASFGDLPTWDAHRASIEYTPQPINPRPPIQPIPCPTNTFAGYPGQNPFADRFHDYSGAAGLERSQPRAARIEALFRALHRLLGVIDLGLFDPIAQMSIPPGLYAQPHKRIANAIAHGGLCVRQVTGRELYRLAGQTFYDVCFYIDSINQGELQ